MPFVATLNWGSSPRKTPTPNRDTKGDAVVAVVATATTIRKPRQTLVISEEASANKNSPRAGSERKLNSKWFFSHRIFLE